MENEIWKTYPEFDFIQGSSLGRVRTLDRWAKVRGGGKRLVKGHVMKQWYINNGYLQVHFSMDGKHFARSVHRIIALCFLPNPIGLPEVNHLDNDRTDNHLNNLEWCTHEYNMQYREKYGVSQTVAKGYLVISVNMDTQEVSMFSSQVKASRTLGIGAPKINDVLKGRHKTAGGYWFVNADNNAVEKTRVKFGNEIADKVEQLVNDKELQPA